MKTLGQVAYEAFYANSELYRRPVRWSALPDWQRTEWERVGRAVAEATQGQGSVIPRVLNFNDYPNGEGQ
jgi:hypothetical protein